MGCVEHDEDVSLRDGPGTECDVAVGLAQAQADLGVEDLPIAIDEGNEGSRCAKQAGGEFDDMGERRVWLGIKDLVLGQRLQPSFLVSLRM